MMNSRLVEFWHRVMAKQGRRRAGAFAQLCELQKWLMSDGDDDGFD